ncbi:lytic transglycosylase domain-containing protein, partial [Escherichia coli]|nr:lytic transglycosylase domain-containing protein [Escherichia coli]
MSNSFDFELVASDQVSDAITRIDEAIRDLEPKLNKTKEGLQLGGQETVDGLNGFISRLENMSKSARDNVQFIGDMVPPLKMVGEISGKLGALGAVGAAGYGLQQVAYGFREASREAYNLDTASKNAGMRVDDFTRLAGAMRILGADSESANASIEGMAKTLKEAASGANGQVLGALSQIGVQIQKNKDGSVDTLKTMEEIARVFPTLRPEQQKSVADAMGFTPEMLALMREGERMKTLLAKSDTFGLTVDPELNKQLSDINGTMNELGASWDGLKQRSQNKLFKGLLSDGSVKDGLEGVTDLFTNGDFTGLSHALGFISSADAAKLRRIQGDKELYNSLPRSERGMVDAGFMTDAVSKRYDANYRATDTANQLQDDMAAITRPAVGGNNYVPYNQGGQYDVLLNEAGKQYGVDPRLLKAIMTQESGGNPQAVSKAGAKGLMQIMPSNFQSTGVTDWTDPRQNIMAGAQILSENLKNSGGNVPLA